MTTPPWDVGVSTEAPADWDDFVRRAPDATHAHLAGWGTVFRDVFGHVTHYWVVRDAEGAIAAGLPITVVRSALFGRHAVSVPFLNTGGPIGDDALFPPLVAAAVHGLAREGMPSVQLRCRRPVPLPYAPQIEKVLVTMPLATSADEQLRRFTGKLRSQIRRAAKDGATATIGRAQIAEFHAVFCEHMRDLGTPAMPRAFFDAAAARFPDDVRIATVTHEAQPIAAGFGFRWREEFEITWAASLVRHKRMAPNMLLYWTLMAHCIEDGVTRFNFGRTTPGSGPHQFKRQWSDDEEALPWYEAGLGASPTRPKKEAAHFQLATRLWRRLPLALATPLGARIVRGIP